MKVDFTNHPSFKEGDEETLEMRLWTELAEAGVLIAPGWMFSATGANLAAREGHFRISFSNADVSGTERTSYNIVDFFVL